MTLVLGPQFSKDPHARFAKEFLASWKPRHSDEALHFAPYCQSKFTRRGFADVLRTLGTIVEAVQAPASAGDSQSEDHVQYRLEAHINDWVAEKEWWWGIVYIYFPTWWWLGGLDVNLHSHEYTSNPGASISLKILNSTG